MAQYQAQSPPPPSRWILHVDMDAFFAAVEIQRRPELAGKPVVVGGRGDPKSRGVAATASYEARRFGIRSAMPLREAYRRCPHAVFLPVDYPAYAAVSEKFVDILMRHSSRIETVGLDEAYLDVTATPDPEALARRIKEEIFQELGLTASVGVAPNKLLAKIASDFKKPDGLTVIRAEDAKSWLADLPVRKLWGVGPKTEERLKTLGIHTVGQLAQADPDRILEVFGRSWGKSLLEHATGCDDSEVVSEWGPKSMSRETTFETDVQDPRDLWGTVESLASGLCEDLRAQGIVGRTVTLKIRFSDFKTITRSKSVGRPFDDEGTMIDTVRKIFERTEFVRPVRLLGVRMSNLEEKSRYFRRAMFDESLALPGFEEFTGS